MVAERLTELWPEIKKVVEFWNHLPQSGRPASESYNAVAVIVTMKVSESICIYSYNESYQHVKENQLLKVTMEVTVRQEFAEFIAQKVRWMVASYMAA